MATWTTKPERDPNNTPYRIHRTPATRELRVIIISEDLIGTNLHFWKGRSTPCTGNNCTACQSGHKARWKGYLQALNENSNTVQIVEITDRVYDAFALQKQKHGTLKGLGVRLSRTNGKPNGPLAAEFDGIKRSPGELPEEANLPGILERMWELRQTALPGCDAEADPQGKPQLRAI